jgi:hypothetical protein
MVKQAKLGVDSTRTPPGLIRYDIGMIVVVARRVERSGLEAEMA